MKTVVIFQQESVDTYFFILEGSYEHLNHVYLNNKENCWERELSDLMALPNGDSSIVMLDKGFLLKL